MPATGSTSFRPGSQGNLGQMLSQAGSGLYQFVRPFIEPTPAGTNPWASQAVAQTRRPIGTQAVLNNKPVYWGGDNYGWQLLNGGGTSATLNSLNAPGVQSRFIQDSVPTGSPAGDRAYRQEASRVAQLTAQDPELQRYEAARLKAVAPGATPEAVQSAEDIGMQMWAKANPTLAAKVKPGQAGYDAIQGVLAGNAARSGFGFTTPQQLIPTPPPGVDIPQGLPAITSFTPAQTYGPKATEIDPELIKKFQSVLNLTGS